MVVDEEKVRERLLLLDRFLDDKELYLLAKRVGIEEAQKYDEKYARFQKEGAYFGFSEEERDIIAQKIAKSVTDEELKLFFDELKPEDCTEAGGTFRGKYYTYHENKGLELRGSWDEVRQDVLEALKQTGDRGYFYLRAVIELYEEKKGRYNYWDGPSYSEVLSKIREISGKLIMPTPRDFAILKAYRLYYKSGSRRYPGHSIPLEIIPAVKRALEEWKTNRRR